MFGKLRAFRIYIIREITLGYKKQKKRNTTSEKILPQDAIQQTFVISSELQILLQKTILNAWSRLKLELQSCKNALKKRFKRF